MVFRWQQSNQLVLLLMCVLYELMMYWIWFVPVWLFLDEFVPVLSPARVYVFWAICTIFIVVTLILIKYVSSRRLSKRRIRQFDNGFAVLGVFYIIMIFLINGGDTLYLGVSLVSMSLLFIMLGNKQTTWYSFLAQLATVMVFSLINFLGIELPTLYDSKMLHQVNASQNFVAVFLQYSLLIFATLKAFFTVKILKQLLHLFDQGRQVLQYQADYDTMTGVKNRRYVMDWIEHNLFDVFSHEDEQCQNEPQDLSVILLDIDFFKRINDTHGHGVGDEVLKEVAKRLKQQSLEYEQTSTNQILVSRYGGEEFLVVMLRTAHDKALKYAEQLRVRVAGTPVYIDSEDLHVEVTASFGVASLSDIEVNTLRSELIKYMVMADETATQSNDEQAVQAQHTNSQPIQDAVNSEQTNEISKSPVLETNSITEQDKANGYLAQQKGSNAQDKALLAEAYQQKLRADFIRQNHSIDNIINMADVALYDAKKMGRNCVISAMQTVSIDVLLEDGFSLSGSYQPSKG